MRLKVTGGYLEVEFEKGTIESIQDRLQELAKEKAEETKEEIKTAGQKPKHGDEHMGKLGKKPKIPI